MIHPIHKNHFSQLQAIFNVRKITCIITILLPEVLKKVTDVLENIPETDPSDMVYMALVMRIGSSEEGILYELFDY